MTQSVFYLSDQTGITAELLGQTLLSQFESKTFVAQTLPYINSLDKANEAVQKINLAAEQTDLQPVLISTIVQEDIKSIVRSSKGLLLDVFEHFKIPLKLKKCSQFSA